MNDGARQGTGTGDVVLVGAGKMGGALLRGWVGRGWSSRLTVIDPAPAPALVADAARHGFRLAASPEGLPKAATLVLAVKPQMLDAVTPSLAALCGPDTLLISIMAGKTAADLSARLPGRVVRAMPNTPAAVGRGVTGAFAAAGVDADGVARATALLEAVGTVEWLPDEGLIDAVTAVSGSGPAYVFHLVEALAEGGVALGLEAAQAERFARATVAGAGALLDAEAGTGADELRRNVTSPGGTTAAALGVLMGEGALTTLMREAVRAARDRARELAG